MAIASAAVDGTGDGTTQAIVDAAYACVVEGSARRTTMEAVAARAGVGVATVYRRFPNKALLVRTVAFREALAAVAHVRASVEAEPSVPEAAVTGFAAFTEYLASSPLLQRTVARDPDLQRFLAADEQQVDMLRLARGAIAELLRPHAPRLRPGVDVDLLAEVFARLAFSLVLNPDGLIPLGDRHATREFARTYLLPLLQETPDGS